MHTHTHTHTHTRTHTHTDMHIQIAAETPLDGAMGNIFITLHYIIKCIKDTFIDPTVGEINRYSSSKGQRNMTKKTLKKHMYTTIITFNLKLKTKKGP